MVPEFSLTYVKIQRFTYWVCCVYLVLRFVQFHRKPNFVISRTLCPFLKKTRTTNESIMMNNFKALQILNLWHRNCSLKQLDLLKRKDFYSLNASLKITWKN